MTKELAGLSDADKKRLASLNARIRRWQERFGPGNRAPRSLGDQWTDTVNEIKELEKKRDGMKKLKAAGGQVKTQAIARLQATAASDLDVNKLMNQMTYTQSAITMAMKEKRLDSHHLSGQQIEIAIKALTTLELQARKSGK
jgi:hypothetical protein